MTINAGIKAEKRRRKEIDKRFREAAVKLAATRGEDAPKLKGPASQDYVHERHAQHRKLKPCPQ